MYVIIWSLRSGSLKKYVRGMPIGEKKEIVFNNSIIHISVTDTDIFFLKIHLDRPLKCHLRDPEL